MNDQVQDAGMGMMEQQSITMHWNKSKILSLKDLIMMGMVLVKIVDNFHISCIHMREYIYNIIKLRLI